MAKKIPFRVCAGCGQQKSKKELVRIVRSPEGEIAFDPTGKKNGRGAYICKSIECLHKAIKVKGLERSLKASIPSQVVETLEKEMIAFESGNEESY
ncbi:MAG TPA: YlxR family protein [Clostridiales bacterium]|nr:YlxR family protein [Clostridiales bacterium]